MKPRGYDIGDGDVCPESPDHGHMFAYPMTQRQVCTHVGHKGWPVFLWDGVTPALPSRDQGLAPRPSTGAPDLPPLAL